MDYRLWKDIAGWVKIKASGKAGDVLKISTYECLTQDGKDVFAGSTGGSANGMAQWFKYIFSGNGIEEWEPRFFIPWIPLCESR